jgi:hypothetical protein
MRRHVTVLDSTSSSRLRFRTKLLSRGGSLRNTRTPFHSRTEKYANLIRIRLLESNLRHACPELVFSEDRRR